MKDNDLKNKKQEWVTPLIKEMTINDNEGKQIYHNSEITSIFTYAPS